MQNVVGYILTCINAVAVLRHSHTHDMVFMRVPKIAKTDY